MLLRPRLKPVTVFSHGDVVVLHRRALERVYLSDPTGAVASLLDVLGRGEHSIDSLTSALADAGHSVSASDVADVVEQLDEWRVLERNDGENVLDATTRRRHASNLRFYDLFSTLSRSSADMQRAAADASVLLLGAGGLGSGILQSLLGLGIGSVRIVDFDVVEVNNFARQFLYLPQDVGTPKVDAAARWAAAYSPETRVEAMHEQITDADRIAELAAGTDVVLCAIDSPANVHQLVNEACCSLSIPFVAGGLTRSTLVYWSVDPGRSACRECLELQQRDENRNADDILRTTPLLHSQSANRATGPVAQLAAGFLTMEAMRYVVRNEPPIAAARYQVLELADGMTTASAAWSRHPECEICLTAMTRP